MKNKIYNVLVVLNKGKYVHFFKASSVYRKHINLNHLKIWLVAYIYGNTSIFTFLTRFEILYFIGKIINFENYFSVSCTHENSCVYISKVLQFKGVLYPVLEDGRR